MRKIIIILMFFLLMGCEGYLDIQCCIKDNETKEPILNAVIQIIYEKGDGVDTFKVDTNGCINKKKLVGCMPKCPQYKVLISAPGYAPLKIDSNLFDFPKDSLPIFLLEKE